MLRGCGGDRRSCNRRRGFRLRLRRGLGQRSILKKVISQGSFEIGDELAHDLGLFRAEVGRCGVADGLKFFLNDLLWGVHRSGFEGRLGFMRDGSWKEIIAQGGFQIGNKFLENAAGWLDRSLGRWGLGWNKISVERRWSFLLRFLRNRSRWLGRNFLGHLFDCGRLLRGSRRDVIDSKFSDRIDRRQFFRSGSVLGGGLHLRPDGVERGFVIGDSSKLFEAADACSGMP